MKKNLLPLIMLFLNGAVCLAETGPFHYDLRDITEGEAQNLKTVLMTAREKLDGFFASTGFAKVYQGEIRVTVWNYSPPIPRSSQFEWVARAYRGDFRIPAARIKSNLIPTFREMTHIYTSNHNRILVECIATYVAQKLGGYKQFPMNGKSLTENLRGLRDGVIDLINFEKADKVTMPNSIEGLLPAMNFPGGMDILEKRRMAHLAAGSFCEFLIEEHGLNKFKQIYDMTPLVSDGEKGNTTMDSSRYQKVYDKSLTQLQRDWEAWVTK